MIRRKSRIPNGQKTETVKMTGIYSVLCRAIHSVVGCAVMLIQTKLAPSQPDNDQKVQRVKADGRDQRVLNAHSSDQRP
jgi:hypothetical protein